MLSSLPVVISGDDPVAPDATETILDRIEDPRPSHGAVILDALTRRAFWCRVARVLSRREYLVLSLAYVEDRTDDWISSRFGVTKQRVQQIRTNALGKLYRELADERAARTHERLLWD